MFGHLGDQRADAAHLGVRAGGGDNEAAAAIRDGGAHVHHADAVTERGLVIGNRICGLGCWQRLARQRGFVRVQPRVLNDPAIGGDAISCIEQHHIAGHQSLGGNLALSTIAEHTRDGHRALAQSRQGTRRLPLRDEADDRVEHDHDQDCAGFDQLAERERDCGGSEQQPHDQAFELVCDEHQR